MNNLLLLLFLIITGFNLSAQDVWVNGYTRKDGTYVQGHYRTKPNHTKNDNYSTIGNINPYTGELGVHPGGKNKSVQNSVGSQSYSNVSVTDYETQKILEEIRLSTTRIKEFENEQANYNSTFSNSHSEIASNPSNPSYHTSDESEINNVSSEETLDSIDLQSETHGIGTDSVESIPPDNTVLNSNENSSDLNYQSYMDRYDSEQSNEKSGNSSTVFFVVCFFGGILLLRFLLEQN